MIRAKIRGYSQSFFWVFITYLLSPVLYLQIFLKRKKTSSDLKILIIQIGKIGDMICTTPLFREIKKKFPESRLDVIIIPRSQDILKNNPHINRTILITDYPRLADKFKLINKLRKERYDWALSLDIAGAFLNILAFWSLIPSRITMTYKHAGEIMQSLFIFSNFRLEYKRGTSVLEHRLSLLKFMGIENPSEQKEVFFTPDEEKKAADFLQSQGISNREKLIGISVSAGIKETEWEVARFAELADRLTDELGAEVVFIGSKSDQSRINQVQNLMKNRTVDSSSHFALREVAALMKNFKLLISVDSGPVYIADALNVPIIDIMGPSDLKEQSPSGRSIIIKTADCGPCLFVFTGARSPFCKNRSFRCLSGVTVQEVFQAAKNLIS